MKNTIDQKIEKFNPNENGLRDHGIFGLPFNTDESKLVLLPLPWEATVSYKSGAATGPLAILEASQQIDLFDPLYPDAWKKGIAMLPIDKKIILQNKITRKQVESYLKKYEKGITDKKLLNSINTESRVFNKYVFDKTLEQINNNKIVGLVGGDHSCPLGYMQALATKYKNFGILHIDAHADLRNAYEGMTYSHASIFYNAIQIPEVSKLVQIGIRDFCEQENKTAIESSGKVKMFTDYEIKKNLFEGSNWSLEAKKIVKELPDNVYISFDIDGLLPYLSMNTGTPVLGGFSLNEMVYLFEEIVKSGRTIIGFDLCEVAKGDNSEWDGNVGARVLYKLCQIALKEKI